MSGEGYFKIVICPRTEGQTPAKSRQKLQVSKRMLTSDFHSAIHSTLQTVSVILVLPKGRGWKDVMSKMELGIGVGIWAISVPSSSQR